MAKIRAFGVAMVAAAGMSMMGAGAALAAEEPATGSSDLLSGLTSGTAETEPVAEEPAGSLEGLDLAALLALLSSGSGESETVAEEPATGSAEGLDLAALIEQLSSGTAEAPAE
ncbi:hypothetical protein [Nocardia caishijiensis]|uniref:Uncharacterized protein n=1 Tax=Nocardia caishijiensis TaxID=184756 RepID=A0ABQ6YUZ8_9NOCA|nr:hypothetical protein [Nocardia caishijiensis]KAF0849281.1 hypothetical protein FNL39_101719 [Nocardia caishijiensis]